MERERWSTSGPLDLCSGVVVDDQGALWILDSASPKTEGVVKGGAKLVKIDLGTNKVAQMISFDDTTAPPQSYLNDVRVHTESDHAFITESGTGATIVVDLNTGQPADSSRIIPPRRLSLTLRSLSTA